MKIRLVILPLCLLLLAACQNNDKGNQTTTSALSASEELNVFDQSFDRCDVQEDNLALMGNSSLFHRNEGSLQIGKEKFLLRLVPGQKFTGMKYEGLEREYELLSLENNQATIKYSYPELSNNNEKEEPLTFIMQCRESKRVNQ